MFGSPHILLSTIPAKEWGIEEETVAKAGLSVRPLSAAGLAIVPEVLDAPVEVIATAG